MAKQDSQDTDPQESGSKEETPFLTITTPLGPDTFTLNAFQGTERISDIFLYKVIMTSSEREIDFNALIGKPATIELKLENNTRYFQGIIGEIEQDGTPKKEDQDIPTIYRAKIYPQLWLLKFSSNCRIFQNQTASEIIQKILQENSVKFEDKLTSSGQNKREFCVQYNESDFNFISRLMEEEGIFYYFTHNEEDHILTLADSLEVHKPCENAATAKMIEGFTGSPALMGVNSCNVIQNITPKAASLIDFNYETPTTTLKADTGNGDTTARSTIYNYPGGFDVQSEGDNVVNLRMQAYGFPQKSAFGGSTVPYFVSGGKFKLEDHPRDSANIEYILYKVYHEAKITAQELDVETQSIEDGGLDSSNEGYGKGIYSNRFTAFPSDITFRPPLETPKPRIYGTQTAIVTGKQDEEIYTEQYGRIKVQFHWDKDGNHDENSSCWIRVAYPWAGQGWGFITTPRIGHEVVVSFLEGDPDKPIVVGSVYNGQNKPPYLPDEPTKSTVKSHSSKLTDSQNPGFNELTFDDKQGSEQIYIHAQKDMKIDIENNQDVQIIGGSRTVNIGKSSKGMMQATNPNSGGAPSENPSNGDSGGGTSPDQSSNMPGGNHQGTNNSPQGNDTLIIANGDKTLTIDTGNYSIMLSSGNMTVKLAKGDLKFDIDGDITFKCTGNYKVDAQQSISMDANTTISMNSVSSTDIKAATRMTLDAGGNLNMKSGGILEAEAGANIDLTSGAAIEAEAGAAIGFACGGAFSAKVGGSFSATAGGTATMTGGGTCTITASTVNIRGGMVNIT